jgi:iron-sulfur cluster repair protein YtfE (RIC family)
MDPFELLKKDHETVAKLFDRIEAASGKAKLNLFRQIKRELEMHTHIEETIFYPAIEQAKETRALTLEAYEEHKVVKELLGELDSAASISDEWKAKLTVLRENVEHHVDEEENELFDKASDVLTGEEAERLGDRMRDEKVKLGASQPESVAPEAPGILQKIANTLGFGAAAQEPAKTEARKQATKTKAGRKAAAKVSSSAPAKKSARTAVKARGSKSGLPSSGATKKQGSKKKGVVRKKAASKSTGVRKKAAGKKARRAR